MVMTLFRMFFVLYASSGFSFVLCVELTNAQVMPVSGILKKVTFEKDDNQMTTNVEPKKNDGLSAGQAAERLQISYKALVAKARELGLATT